MRFLLLLMLAISAVAAPPSPTVLRSPKDASAPKSTPMARTASVSSYPSGATIWVTVHHDLNFDGCNPTNPACVLYDGEQIEFLQLAGQGAQLEFTDSIPSQGWYMVGQFYPPPNDIINGASFFYDRAQRPVARFYRVIPWVPESTVFSPAGVRQPILNRAGFPNIRVWSNPRKR